MPTLEQQQTARKTYLGGSEIAAAMGVSKWTTPLALWAEKTGKLPDDPLRNSEAMEIGLELQEYVARKFERRTGKKLRADQQELVHPAYPYLRGHADYIVLNEDATFDSKTTSAYQLKAWEGETIPLDYVLQQNWYMGLKKALNLKGWQSAYLGVLIGGQRFLWKQFAFDPALFDEQVASAVKFWTAFVEQDVMPVAMANDQDLLVQLFPAEQGPLRLLNVSGDQAHDVDTLLTRRASSLRQIKTEELIVEDCEAKLKQAIGETGGLVTARHRVTWQLQTSKRLDYARLRLDGIYNQYCRDTSTRALRVTNTEVANG